MRLVSLKSLCLVAGFVVPCLGTAARSEAGIIPWVYDTIFGYGWGGGRHAGGYAMGYGYGGGGRRAYAYSAPVYASPLVASYPVGSYTAQYVPDYGWGGGLVADGCCCMPCADSCETSTSVESAKTAIPSKEPTPVDAGKSAPVDGFDAVKSPGEQTPATAPEMLRGIDRRPMRKNSIPAESVPGEVSPVEAVPVETQEKLDTPSQGEPAEKLKESARPTTLPSEHGKAVALRYVPRTQRIAPKAGRLTGNVVRVDRPISGPVAVDTQVATR